jgi:hypothetical protein
MGDDEGRVGSCRREDCLIESATVVNDGEYGVEGSPVVAIEEWFYDTVKSSR